MGKINIDKIDNFERIRRVGQNDVKKTGAAETNPPLETRKTVSEDKVELSNRASEVGKLVDRLKNLPDVREEKVSELREKIAAGDYNPASEDIADAILKDEQ